MSSFLWWESRFSLTIWGEEKKSNQVPSAIARAPSSSLQAAAGCPHRPYGGYPLRAPLLKAPHDTWNFKKKQDSEDRPG